MGSTPSFPEWSPPDPEEVDAFYEDLRRGRNSEVLVPISIDLAIGAGLYIIGTSYLKDLDVRVKGSCCYGVLFPQDMELVKEQGIYRWILWSGGKREVEGCFLGIPTAKEGLFWLKERSKEALKGFTLGNRPYPPDCPPALRRYFSSPEEPGDRTVLTACGRESFQRDERERPLHVRSQG